MGFETPGKFEIIRTVQKGLNSLEVGKDQGYGVWTTAIKTELCKIGRDRFGYSVYARANEVAEACRDDGEWLYDVTWLEYERERDDLKWPATALINAHWVAVCEWGRGKNFEFIIEEFEKLLLARTGFRLMIFARLQPSQVRGDRGAASFTGPSRPETTSPILTKPSRLLRMPYFLMFPRQNRGRVRPRSRSEGVSIDGYSTFRATRFADPEETR